MKSFIIKSIAVAIFASGIIGFVAYRSGLLDDSIVHRSLQRSPNGGAINAAEGDTTKRDSVPRTIETFGSTKSEYIFTPIEYEPLNDGDTVLFFSRGKRFDTIRRIRGHRHRDSIGGLNLDSIRIR